MACSTLVVCEKRSDVPPNTSPIILSNILSEFDEKKADKLHEQLLNLSVDHKYNVPVYTLAGNDMWNDSQQLNDHSPRSMELLILLYQRLTEEVSTDTERIRCIGVSGRYVDLIRDLAENEDLELEIQQQKAEATSNQLISIRSVAWILLSIFDGILSLLLRPFFLPTDANILVKYPVFRPDTFQSIEKRLNISFDVTFTLLTISYFGHVKNVISRENSIVPIRCFDTLSGMISEYRFFVILGYDLLIRHEFEADVINAIEDETSIQLKETVGTLTRRAVWANVSAYLSYGAACRAFDRTNYDCVLITSSGASGNALALPAADHGVDTYVLPHSIRVPPVSVNRPFYTGVFTEGKIANFAVTDKQTEFILIGLPKHLDIHQRRESLTTDSGGCKTLLIGTQGFVDSVRQEFIEDIVPAVLNETEWEVVLKVHPREDPVFYRKTLKSLGIDTNKETRVQVTDSDLYTWIARSELLLTVTSNVGIESVILGTAAASYNVWSPTLRHPLYAKYGSVPSLRDPAALIELLQGNVDAERARQQTLLNGPFMIRGNSINKITDQIQERLYQSSSEPTSESAD
jgi:hypothetical protein